MQSSRVFNKLWLSMPRLHQACAVLHSNIQSLDHARPQHIANCYIKVVSNVTAHYQARNGCRAVNLLDGDHPKDSGQSHIWKQKNSEPLGSIQVHLGWFQPQSKLPGLEGLCQVSCFLLAAHRSHTCAIPWANCTWMPHSRCLNGHF